MGVGAQEAVKVNKPKLKKEHYVKYVSCIIQSINHYFSYYFSSF